MQNTRVFSKLARTVSTLILLPLGIMIEAAPSVDTNALQCSIDEQGSLTQRIGYEVGSDQGSFSVSNAGQAGWSLPIEVPPGINGLAPTLTLSYSPVGPQLSGFSSITRCGLSPVQNGGVVKTVAYEAADEYCLDGMRLVRVSGSGTQGLVGSEYRTEIETFQKIEVTQSNTMGPTEFKVSVRTGGIITYGGDATTNITHQSSGAVTQWRIKELQDRHQNYLTYHYQTSSNGLISVPASIHYGGNKQSSATTSLAVELSYEARPDVAIGYREGVVIENTQRLSAIKTKVAGGLVKEYRIGYQQGEVSGVSRMRSVQECDGEGKCYKPSVLLHTPEVGQYTSTSSSLPEPLYNADGLPRGVLNDLNNDGFQDVVISVRNSAGTQTNKVWLGSQSGWILDSGYNVPLMFDYQTHASGAVAKRLTDLNGDGLLDIVQGWGADPYVRINTGSNWVADINYSLPRNLTRLGAVENLGRQAVGELADVNGDSLVDFVYTDYNEAGILVAEVHINKAPNGWLVSSSFNPPSVMTDFRTSAEGEAVGSLTDINADGLPDWVGVSSGEVWLNNGASWQRTNSYDLPVSLTRLQDSQTVPNAYMVDINSDGLTDIIQNIDGVNAAATWLNTGEGWVSANEYAVPANYAQIDVDAHVQQQATLLDLNQDGIAEYVQSYKDTNGVLHQSAWQHNGMSWVPNSQFDFLSLNLALFIHQTGKGSIENAVIADIDSNTTADFLISREGATDNGMMYTLDVNTSSGQFPGLLSETINGLGTCNKIHYALSTQDNDVYQNGATSAYPNLTDNGPKLLVDGVYTDTGQGGWASAVHNYSAAKVNVAGRGHLGFAAHDVVDGQTGIKVSTDFSQTYPTVGMTTSTQKSIGNVVLSSGSVTYDQTIPLEAGVTGLPYAANSVGMNYTPQGQLLNTVTNTKLLDNDGNSIEESVTTLKASDSETSVKTTVSTYTPRPSNGSWVFGQPTSTRITAALTNQATLSNYTVVAYDAAGNMTAELLEPSDSNMSPSSLSTSYAPSNSFEQLKIYEDYDAFGHARKVTTKGLSGLGVASRESTTTFTADGRFPASSTNAIGHVATMEFDPRFGKIKLLTDPNGLQKETLYDGFAKVIKESKVHESTGATYGRDIVISRWCEDSNYGEFCPDNAVFFVGSFDDGNDAPEYAYFDAFGRIILKKTHAFADSNYHFSAVKTIYDAQGRKRAESSPFFVGGGAVEPSCDNSSAPESGCAYLDYDAYGRLEQKIAPTGAMSTVVFSDHKATTTVVGGQSGTHVSSITTNVLGKPSISKDANGFDTTYTYDAKGQLVVTTDSKGNQIVNAYDVLGRKTQMIDPDMGMVTAGPDDLDGWLYKYDGLGQLVEQRDAKLQTTLFQYDNLGRMERRTDADGAYTVWNYDQGFKGSVDTVKNYSSSGVVTYDQGQAYDEFGRPTNTTSAFEGEAFTHTVGYHGTSSKVDWVEYPSGLVVRKSYDDYAYPEKVESIDLQHAKYQAYQREYKLYLDAQKALEAWKTEHISGGDLEDLSELEGLYRQYGTTLGDFQESLEEDANYRGHRTEAQRYEDLNQQVATKLQQHSNWIDNYKSKYKTHYALLTPAASTAEAHQTAYDKLDKDRIYLEGRVNYYADIAERNGGQVKSDVNAMKVYKGQIDKHINVIKGVLTQMIKGEHLSRYLADFDVAKRESNDNISRGGGNSGSLQCHNPKDNAENGNDKLAINSLPQSHLTALGKNRNFLDHTAGPKFRYHGGQIEWEAGKIYSKCKHAVPYYQKAISNAATASNYGQQLSNKISEMNLIASLLTAAANSANYHVKRVGMYGALLESHSNVITGYSKRATRYSKNAASNAGSYVHREQLHPDAFLAKFDTQIDYLKCKIANQSLCQQYLVTDDNRSGSNADEKHDSMIDFAKTDFKLDIKSEWQGRVFYCPNLQGYACYSEMESYIKQIFKSINCEQESNACASSHAGPSGATVLAGISPVTSASAAETLRTQIHNAHAAKVLAKVNAANPNDTQTSANQIWRTPQTDTGSTANTGDVDIEDFVLIHKGSMQTIADNYRNVNKAQCDARGPGSLIDDADCIYLAEQNIDEIKAQIDALLVDHITDESSDDPTLASLTNEVELREEKVSRLYGEINNATEEDGLFKTYWEAKEVAANGQVKKVKLGNGVETTWSYDQSRVSIIKATKGSEVIQHIGYSFDDIGNLTSRNDYVALLDETFQYDDLNRLVGTTLSNTGAADYSFAGLAAESFAYDELGNITFKSGIGTYSYEAENSRIGANGAFAKAGPHAVTGTQLGSGSTVGYTYDANGNQLTGNGRALTWSSFNKPTQIVTNESIVDMAYGPDRQLYKQVDSSSDTTTLYVGSGFEQVTKTTEGVTNTTNRHHLSIAGETFAVLQVGDAAADRKEHYLHRDHQDSIVAITDDTGGVVERSFYDPFGKKRTAVRVDQTQFLAAGFFPVSQRGYTGHRDLGNGVVHMNGRVYDPNLGRFLSADPHIQSPLNSQSLNRYSYVLNNPLSFVDPSGFFFKSLFKFLKKILNAIKRLIKKVVQAIVKVVKAVVKFIKQYWKQILAVVIMIYAPQMAVHLLGSAAGAVGNLTLLGSVAAGAIGGGLVGLLMTGSLKGMLAGALSGAAFGYIGGKFAALGKGTGGLANVTKLNGNMATWVSSGLNTAGKITQAIAHGVTGGVMSLVQGGKFKAGFWGAFAAKAIALSPISDIFGQSGSVARIFNAGVAGGIASELVGGEFKHGFWPAAFGAAFNEASQSGVFSGKNKPPVDPERYGYSVDDLDNATINEMRENFKGGDKPGIWNARDRFYNELDYKMGRIDSRQNLTDLGNWAYGRAGAAAGVPLIFLRLYAGRAQYLDGKELGSVFTLLDNATDFSNVTQGFESGIDDNCCWDIRFPKLL